MGIRVSISIVFGCGMLFCARGQAPVRNTAEKPAVGDLTQLSIEDLMNLEVTSGAKKEESVQRTAAAIFVITSEDIRRSGATNFPDVLRMVPGLDVAQISASTWAISSRGFSGASSDKMLVLIDGRTVYSPFYSGVLWDAQDLLLADVDRIEVIRGPGAALWGTNAVNGVINIITKPAKTTQGGTITAAGGNVEGGYGATQYGGQIGSSGFYRVYVKGFSKDSAQDSTVLFSQGGWNLQHGGFRADWKFSPQDTLTVEGDLLRSIGEGTTNLTTSLSPLTFGPVQGHLDSSGGNILARWRRTTSPRSGMSLQVYFDKEITDTNFIDATANSIDAEFQDQFGAGKRNDFVWGIHYRRVEIKTQGSLSVSFAQPRITENLESGFLQDEIEIVPARLRLTLGGTVGVGYGNRFSFQPDARLLWTPSTRQAVWIAASRALREVSPTDASLMSVSTPVSGGGVLVVPEVFGNPAARQEAEVTLQSGYRTTLTSRLFVDATGFYNIYTRLRGQDAGIPVSQPGPGTPFFIVPETFNNKISGKTHGVEISGTWKPVSIWKLDAGFAWLSGSFTDGSIGAPPNTSATILSSPHRQVSLRSSVDLPHRMEFDSALYRVGSLDTLGVPGYFRLDARWGWHLGRNTEVAIVGQNLLASRHAESITVPNWLSATSIRRSYYAKVTIHFAGSQKK